MRTGLATLCTVAVMATILPSTVLAQGVVFDNGAPDNSGGVPITTPWSTANDFTLTKRTTLERLDWYALILGKSGPNPVNATYFWRILKNESGRPGDPVVAAQVVSGSGTLLPQYGCCEPQPWEYQAYGFSTSLNSLTLGAGTYWLAIGHFESSYGTNFYWANSVAGVGNEAKRQDATGWKTVPNEGAFALYGDVSTVPEPASIALLGTGLAGVLGAARRRRKKNAE